MPKKLTQKEFIKRSKIKHNNFYSYEKVNYINFETKIEIICPIHGNFFITPHHHLSGSGCNKCAQILRNKKVNDTSKIVSFQNPRKNLEAILITPKQNISIITRK